MHDFKKLEVWKESIDMVVAVYEKTKLFPSDERFGLISQINRSAVSVPSNIAEGAGRNTNGEFNHFLGISNGSSFELETQLIISNRLGYLSSDDLNNISSELFTVQKKLYRLQQSLK